MSTSARQEGPIREEEESHRVFYCARCGAVVRVCRRCDRGQRYCGAVCAGATRRERVREAGRRYQASALGRRNNALRQSRLRAARRGEVTHQGSPVAVGLCFLSRPAAMVAPARDQEQIHDKDDDRTSADARCSFCGALCGRFARFGFLPPGWRRGRERRLRC